MRLAKSLNKFIRLDFAPESWCFADGAPAFSKHAVVGGADKSVGRSHEWMDAQRAEHAFIQRNDLLIYVKARLQHYLPHQGIPRHMARTTVFWGPMHLCRSPPSTVVSHADLNDRLLSAEVSLISFSTRQLATEFRPFFFLKTRSALQQQHTY